jgi:broad-specificity NMP kinase
MIFLAGPPGSGKTTLGSKVCEELDLRFLDLSRPASVGGLPDAAAGREVLEATIRERSADVVALSWSLQQDTAVCTLARRSGALLLLWAHPLDMQARSGYSEPLYEKSDDRTHG